MKLNQLFEAVYSVLLEKSQSVSMTRDMFNKALQNPDIRIGYEVEFSYAGAGGDGEGFNYDLLSEHENWDEDDVKALYHNAFWDNEGKLNHETIYFSEGFLNEKYEGDAYSDSIDELKDDNWDSWVTEKAQEQIDELMLMSYSNTIGEYIVAEYEEQLEEIIRQYAEDQGDYWDSSNISYEGDNENKAHDAIYEFISNDVDFDEAYNDDFNNIREEFKDDLDSEFSEIYQEKSLEQIEENYPFEKFVNDNAADIADALYIQAVSIDSVGEEIGNVIGEEINVFHEYHEEEKDPDEWYIEPDSTTDFELVSAVQPADEGLENLHTIFNWMSNKPEVSTSKKEGLHVGVSIEGKKAKDYDVLKAILFLGEEHLLQQFGREDSTWAEPQIVKLFEHLSRYMQDGKLDGRTANNLIRRSKVAQRMFNKELNTILQGHGRAFSVEKMWDEDSADYIEFRIMGNRGYENRFEEVKETIGRYAMVLDIATTDKYHREYMTKLARLLNKVHEKNAPLTGGDGAMKYYIKQFSQQFRELLAIRGNRGIGVLSKKYQPTENVSPGLLAEYLTEKISMSNYTQMLIQEGVEFLNDRPNDNLISYIIGLFIYGRVRELNKNWFRMIANLMKNLDLVDPNRIERRMLVAGQKFQKRLELEQRGHNIYNTPDDFRLSDRDEKQVNTFDEQAMIQDFHQHVSYFYYNEKQQRLF